MNDCPQYPCRACGVFAWRIGHMFDVNGKIRYPWFCGECGYRTALYVPYEEGRKEERPLATGEIHFSDDLFGGDE
jgi:hypothetical protein